MTVYIDNFRGAAKVGSLHRRWSHLMADTSAELELFARRLGLDSEWIQHPGSWKEHYDLTDAVRMKALQLGATPIKYASEEFIDFLDRRRRTQALPAVGEITRRAVLAPPAKPLVG